MCERTFVMLAAKFDGPMTQKCEQNWQSFCIWNFWYSLWKEIFKFTANSLCVPVVKKKVIIGSTTSKAFPAATATTKSTDAKIRNYGPMSHMVNYSKEPEIFLNLIKCFVIKYVTHDSTANSIYVDGMAMQAARVSAGTILVQFTGLTAWLAMLFLLSPPKDPCEKCAWICIYVLHCIFW